MFRRILQSPQFLLDIKQEVQWSPHHQSAVAGLFVLTWLLRHWLKQLSQREQVAECVGCWL